MQALRVSEDGRRLVTEDGAPFTWLADTAWTLPQRIKADDVEYYLRRRREQGFTVLQIVALDPERDLFMRSPSGEPALIDGDLSRPNERYFAYLDWILDRAEAHGFHVLLLPVWGQLVTGDSWMGGRFPVTVTEENAGGFARWIGERYRHRKSILWCLGGDRQPIHREVDYRNVWRRMAEGLAEGVLGHPLAWNAPRSEWADLPIAYHPSCPDLDHCSSTTCWTDDDSWLALVMLQSGHGPDARNWELIRFERERADLTRPVWDGEPAYEDMPTSWPPSGQRHDSWMVRRRAYWSILAGAFGFTYGHCSVWSSIGEKERNDMFRVDWFDALDFEGARQMRFLRAFLDKSGVIGSEPLWDAEVNSINEMLRSSKTSMGDELESHIQASVLPDGSRLFAYLPSGGGASLRVPMGWEGAWCRWFSPRSGECSDMAMAVVEGGVIHVVAPSCGAGQDWLLIASPDCGEVDLHADAYGDPVEVAPLDKVFSW